MNGKVNGPTIERGGGFILKKNLARRSYRTGPNNNRPRVGGVGSDKNPRINRWWFTKRRAIGLKIV